MRKHFCLFLIIIFFFFWREGAETTITKKDCPFVS